LSGGYNRRFINLQGSSSDYYYYAASVTKDIKKFAFSAIVNNAFQRFYPFVTYTQTPDFYQSNTDDIIYRTVILNVSYKFGGLKGTIKKSKLGIKNDDVPDAAN